MPTHIPGEGKFESELQNAKKWREEKPIYLVAAIATATMLRRRRRLVTSDDEDEDGSADVAAEFQDPQESPQLSPAVASTVVISDDEFVDVADELSPPSSSPPAEEPSGCPVHNFLSVVGVRPRREWLDACLSGLVASHDCFAGLDVGEKARLCFEQFLLSDFNFSSSGGLPSGVHSMHGVELAGPFVLQVDEIVNISLPLRNRYQESAAGLKRCLKLCMTDGVQRVFGMEYRPIKQLEVLGPAGLKVCVCNVHIRRGLLILVPEVVEVLGGSVASLDTARKRLVEEVNKPPRGKRNRSEDALSFATRARIAAWSDVSHSPAGINNSCEASNLQQPREDFRPPSSENATAISREEYLVGGYVAESPICAPANNPSLNGETISGQSNASNIQAIPFSRIAALNSTLCAMPLIDERGSREEFPVFNRNPGVENRSSQDNCSMDSLSNTISNRPVSVSCQISSDGRNSDGRPSFINSETLSNRKNVDHFQASRPKSDCGLYSNQDAVLAASDPAVMSHEHVVACGQSYHCALDEAEVHNVGKAESLAISRREEEIPFTYLALLQAKWTSVGDSTNFVRGKIKCFLTGVKGFQFKQRSKYELQVYVDDGSLISEVLIDHEVVKKGIGYSPEEVTDALSSSDKNVSVMMREKMKQYQLFLANFEGTMLVEINRQFKAPVAREMSQGCSSSDLKLLFSRIKFSSSSKTVACSKLNPIDLSP